MQPSQFTLLAVHRFFSDLLIACSSMWVLQGATRLRQDLKKTKKEDLPSANASVHAGSQGVLDPFRY